MKPEIHDVNFEGHRLKMVMDHASAMDLVHANGKSLDVPAGCNTVDIKFRDANGNAVLAYRQTGFTPLQSDNEDEVNGAGAVILQDSAELPDQAAAAVLDAFMRECVAG